MALKIRKPNVDLHQYEIQVKGTTSALSTSIHPYWSTCPCKQVHISVVSIQYHTKHFITKGKHFGKRNRIAKAHTQIPLYCQHQKYNRARHPAAMHDPGLFTTQINHLHTVDFWENIQKHFHSAYILNRNSRVYPLTMITQSVINLLQKHKQYQDISLGMMCNFMAHGNVTPSEHHLSVTSRSW